MNDQGNKRMIEMKCFGQFELMYEGKSLLKGKTKESQISLVLQYLIHQGNRGASRESLEDVLFEKREIEDKHHALQSVIYNTKKKLSAVGISGKDCIVQRDGMFFWNADVEVREDAGAFEAMYQKAKAEEDESQKLEDYYTACHMYEDEFLPNYNMLVWVSAESRRYKQIFDECVRECIRLLQKKEDYMRIAELGEFAAQKEKHEEYEMLAMDALISMGNYEKAKEYYRRVEKQYMDIQSMDPVQVYDHYIERLADKVTNAVEDLEVIHLKLSSVHMKGVYYCSYPVFKGVYQLVRLSFGRSKIDACLMMCTLVDLNGEPLKRGALSAEVSEKLKDIITVSVRKGDVLTKYSYAQYLILLGNLTVSRCEGISKRINDLFELNEKRCRVKYECISMTSTDEN